MYSLYYKRIVLLFLFYFLLFSKKAKTTNVVATSVTEYKKEFINNIVLEQRRIVEICGASEEGVSTSKRKSSITERRLREDTRVIKNKIKYKKNCETKDDKLVVAEIIDLIKSKLIDCWSVLEEIVYKENFSIKINLFLSNSGDIISANIVESDFYQNDPSFGLVADKVIRAIYKCSPLVGLPTKYYYIWREVTLDFILSNQK